MPTMPIDEDYSDEENLKVKKEFIVAFFDDMDDKIAFLDELYKLGRKDEANILSARYIDGFASYLYWQEKRNKFNFIKILKEHGSENIFSLIHPKMLIDDLPDGKKWERIREKISLTFQKHKKQFYKEQEIVDLLPTSLDKSEINAIKNELYRGTYAAITYHYYRNMATHGLGPTTMSFDNTTNNGCPPPNIDFHLVYKALKNVALAVRDKSINSNKLFGHDFIA